MSDLPSQHRAGRRLTETSWRLVTAYGPGRDSGTLFASYFSRLASRLATQLVVHVEEQVVILLTAVSQDIGLTNATDPEIVVLKPAVPGTVVYVAYVVTCLGSVTVMAYDSNQFVCVVAGLVCREWWRLLILRTRL